MHLINLLILVIYFDRNHYHVSLLSQYPGRIDDVERLGFQNSIYEEGEDGVASIGLTGNEDEEGEVNEDGELEVDFAETKEVPGMTRWKTISMSIYLSSFILVQNSWFFD